jgi:hypothetical protein
MCGQRSTLSLDGETIKRWQDGALVQDAFPYLTAEERELLITGTHPACWNKMIAAEENYYE